MSTITKDLGAVTAYAYAKEKGYTGTEAEFAELMASYATVAEQASQSAQTATEKASEASQSASDAQTAKTASETAKGIAESARDDAESARDEAQQSATTASQKAQEASQSAQTASKKASEASQSATDAQTAKTASETAQGIAESARDDAIDAKTDAESARDMAQQYAESINPDNIFSAYATDTASGSVASFADGADDIPMKSVVVNIEPVQSGSGDPSPDNIRPISGWTGAQVVRTGKNLFSDRFLDYSAPVDYYVCPVKLEIGQKYNVSAQLVGTAISGCVIGLAMHGDSYKSFGSLVILVKTDSSIAPKIISVTSEWDSPKLIVYCKDETQFNQLFENYQIQLELGSTATEYEPYTGNTYSITFPSEAGTVYGGELDVTNGVLTVDRAFIASYNGETLPSEWISDRDVYSAGATPTTGAQVVYNLATPITLTLSPTEVHSLLGQNNVFANTGDSTVTYRADTTLYINRKIAEAISALS